MEERAKLQVKDEVKDEIFLAFCETLLFSDVIPWH